MFGAKHADARCSVAIEESLSELHLAGPPADLGFGCLNVFPVLGNGTG